MLDSTARARDLMVQGASTGGSGPDARAAIAQELTQIRSGLISDANTQILGRPIFGGTTGGTAAYDASGTFIGNGNAVNRTVSDGVSVQVNTTGPAVFSAGSDDLFSVLGDAITQLGSNPTALSGTLDRLDSVTEQMKSGLAEVGTRYGRVQTAQDRLSSTSLDNQSALSGVENVDVAKAIVDLQMQQVAYQASLGATARVMQPSLLDFLK
jgi:flagellar hook-associated protein 3 FlgL